ncbi:MAG: hypothetical protein ACYST2_06955, partial [Planctomycetota bacterium]
DFYAKKGDVEKAEQWDKWASDRTQQKNFNDWAEAKKASDVGDWDKVANYVLKQYENIDDGVEVLSHSPKKDKKGNIVGYQVKLKGDSGKEYEQTVDNDYFANVALPYLSAQNQFEIHNQKNTAANIAAAKNKATAQEGDLEFNRALALEGVKQQGRVDIETAKSTLRSNEAKAELDNQVSLMRQAGYSDDFLNKAIPSLLGLNIGPGSTGSPYRKGPSPEEMAYAMLQERVKNDFKFRKLPIDEQKKIIATDIDSIMSIARQASSGQNRPESNGLQVANNSKGQPVLDTKTGKVVYIQ